MQFSTWRPCWKLKPLPVCKYTTCTCKARPTPFTVCCSCWSQSSCCFLFKTSKTRHWTEIDYTHLSQYFSFSRLTLWRTLHRTSHWSKSVSKTFNLSQSLCHAYSTISAPFIDQHCLQRVESGGVGGLFSRLCEPASLYKNLGYKSTNCAHFSTVEMWTEQLSSLLVICCSLRCRWLLTSSWTQRESNAWGLCKCCISAFNVSINY